MNNLEEDISRSQFNVFFDGDMIELGDTFGDYDINDGARLEISKKIRATFEDVVRDVIQLNPHLSKKNQESLKKKNRSSFILERN